MIIFFIDLDGTIEDSKLDMSLCVNRVRKKLKIKEYPIEYIENYVNKGMKELYLKCFDDFINDNSNNFQIVKSEYEKCYLDFVCENTRCYPGIESSLEYLSTKGHVVVVTNKPEKIARELLNKLTLSQYISDVMGGDSCSEAKPHPLPLQIVAKKLNFNPELDSAYMIGDSLGDIQVAKAFGAKSVWCSWGYLKDQPQIMPDFIIHSAQELQNLC